jgi:hypothetical protein
LRRVERLLALPAAHESAMQLQLRRFKAENSFTVGTARCKNHGEPASPKGWSVSIRAILMAFPPRSRKTHPAFVFAPDGDVDPLRVGGSDFVGLAGEDAR